MIEDVSHPLELPKRSGSRPATTPTNPHTQLDQNAPEHLQLRVAQHMFSLDCVEEATSLVSVPGARAAVLADGCTTGPAEAFMVEREFCHIHPTRDGSLHLNLPTEIGQHAIEQGWAEQHPLAARGVVPSTVVMVYGPRDDEEFDVVRRLISASHEFAHPHR